MKKLRMFSKKSAGFTLLEILVVISIIGILVAIGSVAFSTAQQKGRNARRRADIQAIQNAQEQYYTVNASVYAPLSGTPCSNTGGGLLPYVAPLPSDPKSVGSNVYTCANNVVSGSNVGYCACAFLEGSEAGNSNGAANSTCSGLGNAGSYFCARNLQ